MSDHCQVLDVNDNVPRFESNPYEARVAENADAGARVVQVIAHDADTGANADVSYSFAVEHSKLSNVFAIDRDNGWLTTLVPLDREARAEYEFDVVATDRGSPQQLSDVSTVRVEVTDHNDEPPVFPQSVYEGAVNEDALPGTVILSVTTTDLDIGVNALVSYYITAGDRLGQFSVHHHSGELYVNRALDREARAYYTLVVSATDGAFVATATVNVQILDANDNTPECEPLQPQFLLSENSATGTLVTTIKAKDADEAGTRNARLIYTLLGDDDEVGNRLGVSWI